MKLVQTTALMAFTQFCAGYGMVHGDPDSDDDAVRFPRVPEDSLAYLVEFGRVSDDAPVKSKVKGKARPEPDIQDAQEADQSVP